MRQTLQVETVIPCSFLQLYFLNLFSLHGFHDAIRLFKFSTNKTHGTFTADTISPCRMLPFKEFYTVLSPTWFHAQFRQSTVQYVGDWENCSDLSPNYFLLLLGCYILCHELIYYPVYYALLIIPIWFSIPSYISPVLRISWNVFPQHQQYNLKDILHLFVAYFPSTTSNICPFPLVLSNWFILLPPSSPLKRKTFPLLPIILFTFPPAYTPSHIHPPHHLERFHVVYIFLTQLSHIHLVHLHKDVAVTGRVFFMHSGNKPRFPSGCTRDCHLQNFNPQYRYGSNKSKNKKTQSSYDAVPPFSNTFQLSHVTMKLTSVTFTALFQLQCYIHPLYRAITV